MAFLASFSALAFLLQYLQYLQQHVALSLGTLLIVGAVLIFLVWGFTVAWVRSAAPELRVREEIELDLPNIILRLSNEGGDEPIETKVHLERVVNRDGRPLISEACLPAVLSAPTISVESDVTKPVRIAQYYSPDPERPTLYFLRTDANYYEIGSNVYLNDIPKVYCLLSVTCPKRKPIKRWFCVEPVSARECKVSAEKPPCA